MRRWVNGGSTALLPWSVKDTAASPYLDYVHDVADTHPVRGGKDPWLWSMDDDSRMPVMERLREVLLPRVEMTWVICSWTRQPSPGGYLWRLPDGFDIERKRDSF